jgi:hypothetical protein
VHLVPAVFRPRFPVSVPDRELARGGAGGSRSGPVQALGGDVPFPFDIGNRRVREKQSRTANRRVLRREIDANPEERGLITEAASTAGVEVSV